jgi:hypothetical protein
LFPSHIGTGRAKIYVYLFCLMKVDQTLTKERLQRLQWSSYYTIKTDIFYSKEDDAITESPKVYYWLYHLHGRGDK